MPNWCDNIATITGPKEVIAEVKSILEDPEGELLNWMVPRPGTEEENWYNWNVSNWGTKWDITEAYISDSDDQSITFSFSSAWAPPVDAFRNWAEQNGQVQFTLKYFEPGVEFLGEATYDGEYFDDDFTSGSDDPEYYKDMARDEWGWEFDEEPEPLTEWYKQGVEDKGLDK